LQCFLVTQSDTGHGRDLIDLLLIALIATDLTSQSQRFHLIEVSQGDCRVRSGVINDKKRTP
ncbi:hypothetical protein BgiBS90_016673, partial [Biomphalaria glabrata]